MLFLIFGNLYPKVEHLTDNQASIIILGAEILQVIIVLASVILLQKDFEKDYRKYGCIFNPTYLWVLLFCFIAPVITACILQLEIIYGFFCGFMDAIIVILKLNIFNSQRKN